MKRFNMVFDYQDGHFELTLKPNFVFQAEDRGAAMKIAKRYAYIAKDFQFHYDPVAQDIIINIEKNIFFDRVDIVAFKFYDESKGEYLRKAFKDGVTFYPVMNPDCYVDLQKEEFLKLLREHNQTYLQYHDKITFGSLSYGVKEEKVVVSVVE